MEIYRPEGILAGFRADAPETGCPELRYLGEQWWPQGRLIDRHAHDCWEIYLQIEGRCDWATDSGTHRLGPRGFFAAAPGDTHWMTTPPSRALHFAFAAIDIDPIAQRHPDIRSAWPTQTFSIPAAEPLYEPFRAVTSEVRFEGGFRTAALRLALDYLVLMVARLLAEPASRAFPAMHPAVTQAKRLIDQDPTQPWRLPDLGRLTSLAPNHLAALFAKQVGLPPHRYLIRQRINRAKDLLRETETPITTLALDLGFCSSQHFANAFRAAEATTPSAYRRRMQA